MGDFKLHCNNFYILPYVLLFSWNYKIKMIDSANQYMMQTSMHCVRHYSSFKSNVLLLIRKN